MKLSMFLKGQSGSEHESPKYTTCVGRFITSRTTRRVPGKHCVFLSQ